MKATYTVEIAVTIDRDIDGRLKVKSELDAGSADGLELSMKLATKLEELFHLAEKDALDQYNSEMDSSFPEMHNIIPS